MLGLRVFGDENDSENDTYHTFARKQSPTHGRWLTPNLGTGDCSSNGGGGYWAPGYVNDYNPNSVPSVFVDPSSDNILMTSSLNGNTVLSQAGFVQGGASFPKVTLRGAYSSWLGEPKLCGLGTT
jgi:hypothetical protein